MTKTTGSHIGNPSFCLLVERATGNTPVPTSACNEAVETGGSMTNGTFVPNGNQSPTEPAREKKDPGPLAPPYCNPAYYFDPAFKGDSGSNRGAPDETKTDTGLNPFPGWAWPDDEFVVDL